MITIVMGGQFGDEGKGSLTSWLAKKFEFDMVIRYGAPNAGHTCKDRKGKLYELQSFPCSCFISDALVYFPESSLIDKEVFLKEYALVRKAGYNGEVVVSRMASFVEKEDLGWRKTTERIGSMGSGAAPARVRKLLREARLVIEDEDLKPFVGWREGILGDSKKSILVEATQGFGLSLNLSGFYPHTTSIDLTTYSILAGCGIPFGVHDINPLMVIRPYPVRVPNPPKGTSGLLKWEFGWDEIQKHHPLAKIEYDSRPPCYDGNTPKRIAHFDGDQVRKAIWYLQPNGIFMTHMDWFFPDIIETGVTKEVKAELATFENKMERCVDWVGVGIGEFLPVTGEKRWLERRKG